MSLGQELVERVRISFPTVSTVFRGGGGLEASGSETASRDEVVDQNDGFGAVRFSALTIFQRLLEPLSLHSQLNHCLGEVLP